MSNLTRELFISAGGETAGELLPTAMSPYTNSSNLTSGPGSIALGNNRTASSLPDVTYIDVTLTVFCGIIFLLGVIGNLLVIVVVSRNVEMRTPTNWFLVNLSVADLLVLVICMPSALIEVHAQTVWLLGETACKLVPYLEYSVAHASVLTILAISFERYYAMCYPLRVLYECTTRRAIKIIMVVWLAALVWSVPFLFIAHTNVTYHAVWRQNVTICSISFTTSLAQAYILSGIVMFFVLPFFLLLLLYGFIGHQLARESAFTCNPNSHSRDRLSSSQTWRSRRQVIIMLAIIIVLFFVCLLPNRIFTVWIMLSSKESQQRLGFEGFLHFLYFARVMLYLNSAVNPIIYNVVSTKFRSAFLRVICRKYFLLRRPSGASMGMSHQSFITKTSMAEREAHYRCTPLE